MSRLRRLWLPNRSLRRAIITFAVLAVSWEATADLFLRNNYLVVPPTRVASRFLELAASGKLALHVWTSAQELLIGFAVASLIGIAGGLLLATNDTFREYVDPLVGALYATPMVAVAPLLIIALGIGIESKILLIFILALFPVLVTTMAGVRSTDQHLIEAARAFGASRGRIFATVLLPFALPSIIAGLRLGIGRSLVGIVVAELYGSRAGIGYLISNASQTFDTAGLFVGILILAFTGVGAMATFRWLETALAPWRVFKLED